MLRLSDIKKDDQILGIQSGEIVRIVQVEKVSNEAITVYYKDTQGRLGEQMLHTQDESRLELATTGKAWAFNANGEDFRLGLEAYRISQAALFDPMMAVHTSNVEPLPHQISAVYESMLPKQPLRFVLADDPGAGKTIMAGLLVSELMIRADVKRVLIVSPGSLTEQWQDELLEKFGLIFDIFSREKQEQSASGNYFNESNQLICRLDQLARSEELQDKLRSTEWDLIIVDEAHKLSANYFGNDIKKTKRFLLGELLGTITRHYLLMTATPHNGKEEDFQVWLSLLDEDRFYGKFREGAHKVDISDIMRRMVKEELLKFDGTPLFPERRAYTANYQLSPMEKELYEQVTMYVREEMNRADKLDGQKRSNIGFALTILQRRLASSPEAIYQSLKRRRIRLEARLEKTRDVARGKVSAKSIASQTFTDYLAETDTDLPSNLDEIDEDLSAEDYEQLVEIVVDRATAAETIPELEAEIYSLKQLEIQAQTVVQSGNDKKWEELSSLLQDKPEMYKEDGSRRKLIIFTEHKDTLVYLKDRIGNMLGDMNAVRTISGSTNRDKRREIQEEFKFNPDVIVLVATDAAGEGVNLQNANLMVNYDLPWNPNRLEQRFGRIHRIGQTEVCHLWNLVADETREGDVFQKLFKKIEIEKEALGGKVFDVLGEAFDNVSLRDLLVDAIRYGEDPKIKEKMNEVIDGVLDTEHLKEIIRRNALVDQHMGVEELYSIKEEMEKAEARKLQPYFIRSFFFEAFKHLNGELREREVGRFQIPHVPAKIRERDRLIGESRRPVLKKYERICFEKQHVHQFGKPMADMIHPIHPLMRACTDLILEEHKGKLKQGAVLVDPNDDGIAPKVLVMIDHTIRESSLDKKIASRRLQFIAIDNNGAVSNAGWAPHLDLQPISEDDLSLIRDVLDEDWLHESFEQIAVAYASEKIANKHFEQIKIMREAQSDKTLKAVKDRLVKESNYWQNRYLDLEAQVSLGKQPKIQPEMARRRVDELSARLEQRTKELLDLKNVVSSTPVVIGGMLVIPQGLLAARKGDSQFSVSTEERARVERVAMDAVKQAEINLGHKVKDVSAEKCGWDVTARLPIQSDGTILPDRHIEVKGRAKGQSTITVTRNEIMYALNQADKFILAIVIVDGEKYEGPYYIKNPFTTEPDFGVVSNNYDLSLLLSKAVSPAEFK